MTISDWLTLPANSSRKVVPPGCLQTAMDQVTGRALQHALECDLYHSWLGEQPVYKSLTAAGITHTEQCLYYIYYMTLVVDPGGTHRVTPSWATCGRGRRWGSTPVLRLSVWGGDPWSVILSLKATQKETHFSSPWLKNV